MRAIEFKVPTYITLPRKTKKDKRIAMNLNTYRNLHHSLNNQAKKKFKDIVTFNLINNVNSFVRKENIGGFKNPVKITYTIFNPTKRRLDIMNVGAVVDKFVCDAIVSVGLLEDDSYDYVKEVKFLYGGYKKNCDYVIVKIEEI